MAISGAATSGSVSGISGAALDPVDLVNVPVANPALEVYPGAVDSGQYAGTYGDGDPTLELSAANIASNSPDPFASALPDVPQDGGYQDASWVYGTQGNAPYNPWDSDAGLPFSGVSGGVNPDIHADDGSGSTFAAQYVVGADFGSLSRNTRDGQTYNREFVFDPVTGMNVPAPNGRTDLDQYQYHDPAPLTGGGYAPWDKPYAERPIMNNLAYEAMPILPATSYLTPSGQLPDKSVYNQYEAVAYESPNDPYVGVVNPPVAGNNLDFGLVM